MSRQTHNRLTFLLLITILLPVMVFLIFRFGLVSVKEPLYIAIVGPMSGSEQESGKALVRGAQLFLDQVNRTGGVHGRRIELLIYDDQNDPELAHQRAQDIAQQSRALAVLGHYFSSTSLAAAQVYRAGGIAAISGSATADVLTQNNSWYFRTVYDNGSQATFLGYYAYHILGHQTVGIIYDQDAYGDSLMRGFEHSFRATGGQVKYKWPIDAAAANRKAVINNTVHDLLQLQARQADLDVLFLAVNDSQNTIDLFTAMKRKGLTFPLIGGDALSESTFFNQFKQFREEQANPGYFTDGLYATSPIIFDIAGDRAQQFYRAFVKTYKEVPGWSAATYYDAAQVAVEAIRRSWRPDQELSTARRRVRDALSKINKSEVAVDGVTGPLYFDRQGNVQSAVTIGVYERQYFISALTQIYPVTNLSRPGLLEPEWQDEDVFLVDGRYMYKTNVVYTGIDLNRVHDIKRNGSSYTVDFYLWFRSHKSVDPSRIEFVNALKKPGQRESTNLGAPITKKVSGNVVYRAYRVKELFSATFNLRDYPFDTQAISIQFRHTNLTRERIMYVTDVIAMGNLTQAALLRKFESTNVFEAVSDWQISGAHFFQDTMHTQSTLGSPEHLSKASSIDYSRFNLVIDIKREVGKFVTKSLLPVVFIVSLAYVAFFLPAADAETLITMLTGTVISVVFFHSDLSKQLDVGYAVALDYAFYVIYGLLVFELIIGVIEINRRGKAPLKRLMLAGKIVYPLVMVSTALTLVFLYSDLGMPEHKLPAFDRVAPTTMPAAREHDAERKEEVVLTLSSWRADDDERLNRLFAHFQSAYPHITIRHEPLDRVEYDAMLVRQLEAGIAPDLFYLLPYGPTRVLFEDGFLEPLEKIPGLRESFTAEARQPWTTDGDGPYGVPFLTLTLGLYYNTSLFDQLGIPLPTTWEALLKTAEALQNQGVIPFANSSKDYISVAESIFMNLAPAFIGGQQGRLQYAVGQRCFNDAHTIAAFEAVKSLEPYLSPSHREMTYYNSQQLFLKGQAAMWFADSTVINAIKSAGINFEWHLSSVPAPAGKGTIVIVDPYTAIGLNAASPHKAAAKKFLSWLTTPAAAVVIGQELPGFIPSHRHAPKPDIPQMQSFLAQLAVRQRDVAWVWPRLMEGEPTGLTLLEEVTPAVLMGTMTPHQAADRFQQGLSLWYKPAQRCKIPDLDQQKGFEKLIRRFVNQWVRPPLEQSQVIEAIRTQNAKLAQLFPAQVQALEEAWWMVARGEAGFDYDVLNHKLSNYLRSLVQQSSSLFISMMVLDAHGFPIGISRRPSPEEVQYLQLYTHSSKAIDVSPTRFDRASEHWYIQVSWPLADPQQSRPAGRVVVSINPVELATHYCWHNSC